MCITCVLGLRCSEWIIFWIETCFPFKCNTIFAVSWLHIGSVVCLMLAALFSDAAHPRDVAFNENLKANTKLFEKSSEQFLNITNKTVEMDYLISRWDGMFDEVRPRGQFQQIFMYVCLLIAAINLVLYITAIPVMMKDCFCGATGENFYRNDWRLYKGKVGFIFTACIAMVTFILMVAIIMEGYDVVDTELLYEQYFPYCMRDRYVLNRFCLLSKRETDNSSDWCDDIKHAFSNSYVCTEYKRRFRSVVSYFSEYENLCLRNSATGLASLAVLFHIMIIAGYAQMSYRPWAWANLKKRSAENALWGDVRKKRRKDLANHAPKKVQIAIEKKKIKLAEQKKLEQDIKDAQQKRNMDIQLKNVRRRLAHRASRKERKEMKQKARQERREMRANKKKDDP